MPLPPKFVHIVITDENGTVEKLPPAEPPRQKKNGIFLFRIENLLDRDVEVNLDFYANADFVDVTSRLPTTAPANGGVALAQVNAVKAKKNEATTVKYRLIV